WRRPRLVAPPPVASASQDRVLAALRGHRARAEPRPAPRAPLANRHSGTWHRSVEAAWRAPGCRLRHCLALLNALAYEQLRRSGGHHPLRADALSSELWCLTRHRSADFLARRSSCANAIERW